MLKTLISGRLHFSNIIFLKSALSCLKTALFNKQKLAFLFTLTSKMAEIFKITRLIEVFGVLGIHNFVIKEYVKEK